MGQRLFYPAICPRVTPSWLKSFNSRQSWGPVISPRKSWRYLPIVRAGLLRRFVEKFQPEMPHAQCEHAGDILRAGLRPRVEDGVAAAGVGLDRMLRAHAVAQPHLVPVAGPAAVAVIGAVGEKRAEDDNAPCETSACAGGWSPRTIPAARPRSSASSCGEIQIVARRHALQAELVFEIVRRQPVGDVQRIIADAPLLGEKFQVIVIAHQVTVGSQERTCSESILRPF